MKSAQIHTFETHWRFARGLSGDLLRSLENDDLLFSPGDRVGPLWKQFRHIGRVQENYLNAIETGRIVFTCEGLSYGGGASKQQLLGYLDQLDKALTERLRDLSGSSQRVDWPDGSVDCAEHLTRMVEHEILHHGMLIVYFQLLGRSYPESWQAWGV